RPSSAAQTCAGRDRAADCVADAAEPDLAGPFAWADDMDRGPRLAGNAARRVVRPAGPVALARLPVARPLRVAGAAGNFLRRDVSRAVIGAGHRDRAGDQP